MQLTRRLLYYVNRRKIPGKIDIGKHRARVVIQPHQKYLAATDLIREQENLDILSRPYLTQPLDGTSEALAGEREGSSHCLLIQKECLENIVHERMTHKVEEYLRRVTVTHTMYLYQNPIGRVVQIIDPKEFPIKEEDVVYQQMQEEKFDQLEFEGIKQRQCDNMPKHFRTTDTLMHLLTNKSW